MAFDLDKFIEKTGFDLKSSQNPTAAALKKAMAKLDEEEENKKLEQAMKNLTELRTLYGQREELVKKFNKEVNKIDESLNKMGGRLIAVLNNSPPPPEEEKQEAQPA